MYAKKYWDFLSLSKHNVSFLFNRFVDSYYSLLFNSSLVAYLASFRIEMNAHHKPTFKSTSLINSIDYFTSGATRTKVPTKLDSTVKETECKLTKTLSKLPFGWQVSFDFSFPSSFFSLRVLTPFLYRLTPSYLSRNRRKGRVLYPTS